MKNEGTNTARIENMESRRAMAVRLHASTTARARETPGSICVWMFSISTVASSTSTPTASARPPSVMMLRVWPVIHSSHHGAQQRERDVEDHDQRAAPVAQEQQHHEAGERRAQQAFEHQPANRIDHEGRLIELEAHIHVVRQHLLEIGDGRLDRVDDGQGGGVGALGDRDIDRPLAVDVRVGGDDIGAVLDGADIAQINGGAGDRADGRAQQLGEVAAQRGVGAGDALDGAGVHVARRHHQGGLVDGGDGLFGRDAVLAELVGIERDHDGALVSAERRRRGDARKRGEERAHAVDGEILQLAGGARRRC